MIEMHVAIDDLRVRAFWNRWIRPSVQQNCWSRIEALLIYGSIYESNLQMLEVEFRSLASPLNQYYSNALNEWFCFLWYWSLHVKTFSKRCLTTLDCLFWPGNEFKPYCKGFGATPQTSAGNRSRLELHRRTEAPSCRCQRSVCSAAWGIRHISASLTLLKVTLKSKWTIPVL